MRGAFTRETLDKSSLLKIPAKIKLGRGTKEHGITNATPSLSPEQASPICKVKNPRE
jgi:hypothetical protein